MKFYLDRGAILALTGGLHLNDVIPDGVADKAAH
jgi:hypothetical protein